MGECLLFEIGTEELPASFVDAALAALPAIVQAELSKLRLSHGAVRALGTPRRLSVLVNGVESAQRDLDEEVVGPPAKVAFDAQGQPTKAASSFAKKLGCSVAELTRVTTDKGEYIAGRRKEAGAPAVELLPGALARVAAAIPFAKSMRWSNGDTPFGRPVRWLVGLLGESELAVQFAGLTASRASYGHRFLAPDAIHLSRPEDYVAELREHHVLVDADERQRIMLERLRSAAKKAGGSLIDDEFLVKENSSLVEEPHVVVGSFDEQFLQLPERVILDVAKGHQRYFGMRDASGQLMSKYLAVVGTALNPENIRLGNDRVMRARLADAQFFYREDLKKPLAERRDELDGIVFHKRLGSVGDKVRRLERLVKALGVALDLRADTIGGAQRAAGLCKTDLVTLMVGELPELQGEMGRAYARAQGVDPRVCAAIVEHYQPRGADDPTAASDEGALLAVCDRIDTLTGCFAIGLVPSGAADPLALRRSAIGVCRTLIDRQWPLSLSAAFESAYAEYEGVKLDLGPSETVRKLSAFMAQRMRGVLAQPQDVVDACVASGADVPHDLALRARALAEVAPDLRLSVGEVFKRASNIAKDAPGGEAHTPAEEARDVHPSERRVFAEFVQLRAVLSTAAKDGDYPKALSSIAQFAPVLGQFFDDVFVMVEDLDVRNNRLRLMRQIHEVCSRFANFRLLAKDS